MQRAWAAVSPQHPGLSFDRFFCCRGWALRSRSSRAPEHRFTLRGPQSRGPAACGISLNQASKLGPLPSQAGSLPRCHLVPCSGRGQSWAKSLEDEFGRRRAHEIEETEWQARKRGRRFHGVYWVLGTLRTPRTVRDKAGKVGRPHQTASWVAFWVETAV